MAKDSPKLFGVPIADGVHKQLERRKKIVSHNGKDNNITVQEANLLKNKGGWVRLVSGINVVPDEHKEQYQWLKTYIDSFRPFGFLLIFLIVVFKTSLTSPTIAKSTLIILLIDEGSISI